MNKKDKTQEMIDELQRMLDVHWPDMNSSEERKKIFFDLAVKHFILGQLGAKVFRYRFFNEAKIQDRGDRIHLKFVVFNGDRLPPVPERFWVTFKDNHYLCKAGPNSGYQEMTIILKTIMDGEILLGEMPVYIFDDEVEVIDKCRIGELTFLKDLFDQESQSPDLCAYYMHKVFGLRMSFPDLNSFLQRIDMRVWEQKLKMRTPQQEINRREYYVPGDLDKQLLLSQEEVDLLLAAVK